MRARESLTASIANRSASGKLIDAALNMTSIQPPAGNHGPGCTVEKSISTRRRTMMVGEAGMAMKHKFEE